MRNPSEMVLKAFLSRSVRKEALERFLPEGELNLLKELPAIAEEVTPAGFANSGILEKVHWSWFLPTLKTYTVQESKLFLSALNPYSAKNLAKQLDISSYSQEINEMARSYLRHLLLNTLLGPRHRLLPKDYLPPTPLKPLLLLSKKELVKIIDFLSLYDLAAELRQIVETKILKKIYSLLSEEERKFLKNAMTHKEQFILVRMGLDRWDGNEESLRIALHRRGLGRFGTALSGQDPDFNWYICHQLDIGRGNALFNSLSKEPVHGVSDTVIRQIEDLISTR